VYRAVKQARAVVFVKVMYYILFLFCPNVHWTWLCNAHGSLSLLCLLV